MGYSVVTKIGNGATNQFAVAFALGYYSVADITCRVNNEADGGGIPIYRTISEISEGLFLISGAPPANGVNVVFTRTVDPTTLKVDWTDDANIDEDNMNDAQLQALYLVHQFLDGRNGTFAVELDMGNHRIINLADPVGPQDATTKAWVIAQPNLNIQAAIDAANAANASATAAAASAAAASTTLAGALVKTNNLSDLNNFGTARSNLGLGTSATMASAAVADYRASTALKQLPADVVSSAAAKVTLVAASNVVTPDLNTGFNFTYTMPANTTLANMTNQKEGWSGFIEFINGASAFTLAYGSNYKWVNGSVGAVGSISTRNIVYYTVLASGIIQLSMNPTVS